MPPNYLKADYIYANTYFLFINLKPPNMKNLQFLLVLRYVAFIWMAYMLFSCDISITEDDCLGDQQNCTYQDRSVSKDSVKVWTSRFDSIFNENEEVVPISYACSRQDLLNFVDGYEGFRIYFGLPGDELSTLNIVTTHIEANSCSDAPDTEPVPDVYYWDEDSNPDAVDLTENWRNVMEVSRCDSISSMPNGLDLKTPLAYTFNVDSAKKDFLDSTKYDSVYLFLGIEKLDIGGEVEYLLKAILQGEETLTNTGGLYLDRATPCPRICGNINDLQNQAN